MTDNGFWDSEARSPCPSASPIAPSRVIVAVRAVFDHGVFVVFIFVIFLVGAGVAGRVRPVRRLPLRSTESATSPTPSTSNVAAVFQNCNIYLRKPRKGEPNMITAQGRSDPNQNTGIVIQFSNISSSAELLPVCRTVRSYLSRPWMKYSRTVYMQNNIGSLIDPAGWLPWNEDFATTAVVVQVPRGRHPHGDGVRHNAALQFRFLHRRNVMLSVDTDKTNVVWLPSMGVPFASGL
ncbi:hypothetical protein Taro_055398 [Colocasia esculenta]|uniref:Pectinesterase catalytic domain-containing protein n=1 Tax=Colocasia esculenta TaxID=4460 RepID=A0A843XU44_COLES|nr:hypothetical protein [Colocasia esculenta]